jgi:hypothetical protein
VFPDCLNCVLRAGWNEPTVVEWKERREKRLIQTDDRNEHNPHRNSLQFLLQVFEQFDHTALDNLVCWNIRMRGCTGCAHEYGARGHTPPSCVNPENGLVESIGFPHQASQPVPQRRPSDAPADRKPDFQAFFVLVAEQEETAQNSRLKRIAFGENC